MAQHTSRMSPPWGTISSSETDSILGAMLDDGSVRKGSITHLFEQVFRL